MLVKLGVDISRLKPNIRRALKAVEFFYRIQKEEPVITSTYEGNHAPSSLHYTNDAIDVRLPKHTQTSQLLEDLEIGLGDKYDIVVEQDHIHIEYDPK